MSELKKNSKGDVIVQIRIPEKLYGRMSKIVKQHEKMRMSDLVNWALDLFDKQKPESITFKIPIKYDK